MPIIASAFPVVFYKHSHFICSKKIALSGVQLHTMKIKLIEFNLLFPIYRKFFDKLLVSPFGKHLEKKLIRSKYLNIFPLSQYTKNIFSKTSKQDNVTLGSPIDTEEFKAVAKFSRTTTTIGFIGRLADPRKNISLLLQSLKQIDELNLPIKLILCGEELNINDIKYIKDNNLSELVDYHGFVSRDKLISIYNDIDIFVIPSFQEGLAIVGLEAMATGSPIITTRCGGPEEYVKPGLNGYIINFSANELTKKVSEIISDDEKKVSMSYNSRKIVEKNYSYESFTNKIKEAMMKTRQS